MTSKRIVSSWLVALKGELLSVDGLERRCFRASFADFNLLVKLN